MNAERDKNMRQIDKKTDVDTLNVKDITIRSLDEYNIMKCIDSILAIDNLSLGHYRFWYKENFFLELPRKWVLSKIALLNNVLVGYCIVSAYATNKAHIHRMSVHPRFRMKGIGEMLIQHALAEAFHEKVVEITLESLCDNHTANLFYEKLGFKELGEGGVNRYLFEKDKLSKSNKYYVINNKGNRRVFSIKVNNFTNKNSINKIEVT